MEPTRRLAVLSAALFTAAAVMLSGVGWLNVPTARAGDYECRETLGAVTITGNLIVPDDATCNLFGTQVQGSIVVKSRSVLRASNVNVTGGVSGQSQAIVEICDSYIGNGISLAKGEDLGLGGYIDIHRTEVVGSIQLQDNRYPVTIDDNVVSGSIEASKQTGGLEISRNQIGGGLSCQDNFPPPTGSGNVAKQFQGQCPSPAFGTTSP